jgi:ParB family chromosome partitioning protein
MAAERGLSVRDVERRVRRARRDDRRARSPKPQGPSADHPYARRAEQQLARALGTAVRVRLEGKARGRIEIPFGDPDDFDRILGIILGPAAAEEDREVGAA